MCSLTVYGFAGTTYLLFDESRHARPECGRRDGHLLTARAIDPDLVRTWSTERSETATRTAHRPCLLLSSSSGAGRRRFEPTASRRQRGFESVGDAITPRVGHPSSDSGCTAVESSHLAERTASEPACRFGRDKRALVQLARPTSRLGRRPRPMAGLDFDATARGCYSFEAGRERPVRPVRPRGAVG